MFAATKFTLACAAFFIYEYAPSTADVRKPPLSLATRSAMIFAFGATPATPSPLLTEAAMMPATCVPWPSLSIGSSSPMP